MCCSRIGFSRGSERGGRSDRVGAIFLVGLVVLARRYLFAVPVAVLALSLALFVAGAAVAVT